MRRFSRALALALTGIVAARAELPPRPAPKAPTNVLATPPPEAAGEPTSSEAISAAAAAAVGANPATMGIPSAAMIAPTSAAPSEATPKPSGKAKKTAPAPTQAPSAAKVPAPLPSATPAPVASLPVTSAEAAPLSVSTAAPVLPAAPSVAVKPLSGPALEESATRDFERAQALIEQGQESQALVSLTDFMRRYPKHRLSGEVQFYVAEVYFRQRKFREALDEYAKVRALSGEKGVKIPYAILRKGECFHKLGENVKAQIEWNALVRRYPDSPAAGQARVLLKGLP